MVDMMMMMMMIRFQSILRNRISRPLCRDPAVSELLSLWHRRLTMSSMCKNHYYYSLSVASSTLPLGIVMNKQRV